MSSNPIFLFPTELEAATLRRLQPDWNIVVCGVGMAATAATLSRLYRAGCFDDVRCVVLCGIAGGYDSRVAVGEVVEVISERCAELPQRFQREYHQEPYTTLRGVTSNTVHSCMEGVTDAEIENMEGAALFAMAEELGFRAVEIRGISNRVGEEFNLWRVEEALQALARVLITI